MSVVTDYIAQLDSRDQAIFLTMRSIIHELIPDIEEKKSYGLPTYAYKGTYLISFARNKTFLSIYPGSEVISHLKKELSPYALRRGTISFTADKPLSESLMRSIITYCKAAIDARMARQ